MKHNADNHRFVVFLKNEKFIEWKLFPSKESDDYWEDFLKKNPDAREDFLLAEEHFNHIHFSPAAFPEEKKAEAIEQLERDVRKYVCWKEGYLLFDDIPVNEVLKQIGRHYNLSFDFTTDVSFHERTCLGKIIFSRIQTV